MKNEKLLVELNKIQEIANKINNVDIANITKELISTLSSEIAQKSAKELGVGGTYKAVNQLLKSAQATVHERLHKAIEIKGHQYILDGYCMIKLNDHMDIPTNKDTDTHFDRLLENELAKKRVVIEKLPTVTELKTYIATEKAKQKAQGKKPREIQVSYDLGQPILINAEWLLMMLTAFPKPRVTANNTAFLFEDDNIGCGLVMGLRRPN